MNKIKFRSIYDSAIDETLRRYSLKCRQKTGKSLLVELHGGGTSGRKLNKDDAFDSIYIDDMKYYRVIDLAVKSNSVNEVIIFARISEYKPSLFEDTYSPSEFGPFKILDSYC
jgi:hypothetical protein